MNIQTRVSAGLLSAALFIMGCATGGVESGGKPAKVDLPPGDQLKITGLTPAAGELSYDEQVKVTVAYRLDSAEEAMVLTRPFNNGRQSQGYMAHAPITCTPGKGVAETWFTFRQDASVEEIRVSLVDKKARKLLRVITNAYPASWSAPK